MKIKHKSLYEAKGGMMTKNDVINSIGNTLSKLAENHRGELVIPMYSFHITLKETIILNNPEAMQYKNKEGLQIPRSENKEEKTHDV
jgi:hypothetical protein